MADDGSRVDFTKSAADRIAKVVRIVERGSRDQKGPHYSRVWEDGSGGGGSIRLGLIETSWAKGETIEVVELNEAGLAVTPRKTFDAANYFVNLSVDCGNKKVACAKVGGTWVLIAAEC